MVIDILGPTVNTPYCPP